MTTLKFTVLEQRYAEQLKTHCLSDIGCFFIVQQQHPPTHRASDEPHTLTYNNMVTHPNSEVSTRPHPTLTAILNEPTAKDINLLRTEIYTNASSVPSTLGRGNHGHLGTVTDAAYYLELSNQLIAFMAPGPTRNRNDIFPHSL